MKLLTNTSGATHLAEIKEAFQKAENVSIAVAFLKQSGLSPLLPMIKAVMKRKGTVQIICGLDFALTEPAALMTLHKLFEGTTSSLKLFLSLSPSVVFHPKAFLFNQKDSATLIIGSSNLTGGGLEKNEECSLSVELLTGSELFRQATEYFERLGNASEEATLVRIMQYETFYLQQSAARKGTRAKPPVAFQVLYTNLERWLRTYRRENDINDMFRKKTGNYREAQAVLNTIADTLSLSRTAFIPLFERLVGGSGVEKQLWHSGSIYRKKTSVFDHPREFQRLVRFIRDNRNQSPAFVFENAIRMVQDIPGSGVNTVTEIMMSYNPQSFANLNENPIKVLREVGRVNIPAHRNSYDGPRYQMYCELVTEISRRLALRNMLEADSFFNSIYWKL